MNPFKEHRELKGYPQKEVAAILGVTVQAVSFWETGKRMPSYEQLLKLADLYHVSTDTLLGRKYEGGQDVKGKSNLIESRLLEAASELNQKGIEELIRYSSVLAGNPIYTEEQAASSAG